jgi:hypothetical protein
MKVGLDQVRCVEDRGPGRVDRASLLLYIMYPVWTTLAGHVPLIFVTYRLRRYSARNHQVVQQLLGRCW